MRSRCCWPVRGGSRSTWTWSAPASGTLPAAGPSAGCAARHWAWPGSAGSVRRPPPRRSAWGFACWSAIPYRTAEDIEAAGCERADWETVLAESDYISLHIPLTPDSLHLINAGALRAMKSSAVLINTARGGLVDQAALAAAIRAGEIAGAALDVLAEEPPPGDSPLLHDPRILITPHAGWYSAEAQRDVVVRACEDVQRVLSGHPARSPANVPTGGR